MDVSQIASSSRFLFPCGIRNEEVDFFASKLYGPLRRRRMSAIRDFPSGCGLGASCASKDGRDEADVSMVPQAEDVTVRRKVLIEDNGSLESVVGREEAAATSGTHSGSITPDCWINNEEMSIVRALSTNHATGCVTNASEEDGLRHQTISSPGPEVCGNDLKSAMEKEPLAEGEITIQTVKANDKGEEVDPKAGLPPSYQQDDLKCYKEVQFCGSKIYGPYKRRKISAFRDFPPGCGSHIAKIETKECADHILIHSDHIRKPSMENKAFVEAERKSATMENIGTSVSKEVKASIISDIAALRRAEDMSEEIFENFLSKGNIDGSTIGLVSSNKWASKAGSKKLKAYFMEDSDSISESRSREKNAYKQDKNKVSHKTVKRKSGHMPSHAFARNQYNKSMDNIQAITEAKKHVDVTKKNIKNNKRKYAQVEGGVGILLQERRENRDLEAPGSKLIVQALMAAPNCPWRNGRHFSEVACPRMVGKAKDKKSSGKTSTHRLSDSRELVLFKDQEDDPPINEEYEISPFPTPQELSVMVVPDEPLNTYKAEYSSGGESTIRNQVRRALRLFQVICRMLLKEEESKLRQPGQTGRIDLRAANILKEKNEWVNTGKPILGIVPGVEIGDEFHYRSELSVVGLHRPFQGGIDSTKRGNVLLATSIVAGGSADELDSSDVLIYSGSGGLPGSGDKLPEDQKLERGNLALKNSIEAKEPVRVIRGSKELKSDTRDGKNKLISTFIYDGLYLVEKYWKERVPQGFLAFKYQLRRIPGQPELSWKEVKKSKKPSARPGVCVRDISDGKERIPLCAVNTFDEERLLPFTYITKVIHPASCLHDPPVGCSCINDCSDSEMCACAEKNGGLIPFNYNGAIVQAKPLVYECGPSCKCPPTCPNRISQNGIKIQLEVFKTKSMGWGIRSLNSIPSGSFICEYIGELLPDSVAEERDNREFLFDIRHNHKDSSLWEGLPAIMPDLSSTSLGEPVNGTGFTIDAAKFGNVGRFINRSYSPNIHVQNVLYDHDDKSMPHIMFFAAENIPPLRELTYCCNYNIEGARGHNSNIN